MRMILTAMLLVFGVCGLSLPAAAEDKKTETKKVDTRVFELRTYYAEPGKMTALHARFRDHTNTLFKKHGMDIIGFWVPIDPKEAEQKLVYILAYPSKEAAEKSWKAFRDDPVWNRQGCLGKGRQARHESRVGVPEPD